MEEKTGQALFDLYEITKDLNKKIHAILKHMGADLVADCSDERYVLKYRNEEAPEEDEKENGDDM